MTRLDTTVQCFKPEVHVVFAFATFFVGGLYVPFLDRISSIFESAKVFMLINLIVIGSVTILINIFLTGEILSTRWYTTIEVLNICKMVDSVKYPKFLYSYISLLPWHAINILCVALSGRISSTDGILILSAFPGGLILTALLLLYNLGNKYMNPTYTTLPSEEVTTQEVITEDQPVNTAG